jgi:hypothetical protein
VWLLAPGLMLALATATVLCRADEPKKDKVTTAMEDIAMAYQLADIGKRADSPEALLAAARLFSRLNKEEIGLVHLANVKPGTAKADEKKKPGEEVKEEGGEKVSFADEIKKLKEEARKLNSPKNEKLAELIDAVDDGKGMRGSLGGPAWMGPYTVFPGSTNSLRFNFRGRDWAQVMVSVTNGAPVQLEVYNLDGALIGTRQGRGTLEIGWTPAFTRGFDVYVTGTGARPANYNVYKN